MRGRQFFAVFCTLVIFAGHQLLKAKEEGYPEICDRYRQPPAAGPETALRRPVAVKQFELKAKTKFEFKAITSRYTINKVLYSVP